MKTKLCHITILILLLSIVSCQSDDNCSCDKGELATVNTNEAQVTRATTVTLSGVIGDNGGGIIHNRGVCYSDVNALPTLGTDPVFEDYNNATGTFTFTIPYVFRPETTYYARSYVINDAGLQYGNTISFTTGRLTNTVRAFDIYTTFAGIYIKTVMDGGQQIGVAYGSTPNPTVNDNYISQEVYPVEDFSYYIPLENLSGNTTYYVRSYAKYPNGEYYYGDQLQFKTAGYTGEGGGLVAYDKGEYTDGWRYLEIHTSALFSDVGYGAIWSENNTIVPQTISEDGKVNSEIAASYLTNQFYAVNLCLNLTRNGKSDWYLGSREEMERIGNSLAKINVMLDQNSWTSTQYGETSRAFYVFKNEYNGEILYSSSYRIKSHYCSVYPIRRY